MPARPQLDAAELHQSLSGTPYSFLDDERQGRTSRAVDRLHALDDRVQQAQHRAERIRSETADDLEEAHVVRLVYESNALEGLGLDLAETRAVISQFRSGEFDEIQRLTAALRAEPKVLEVIGLQRAYDFSKELVEAYPGVIHEIDLRNLHKLIVGDVDYAGRYRISNVEIAGSDHVPSDVIDIPRQMRELATWMNATDALPPVAAAVVHAWLTHIHPFRDGNGRLARLLANLILAKAEWPPLIIRNSIDRGEYLDALATSDEGGDIIPLMFLFFDALQRSTHELANPEEAIRALEKDILGTTERSYALWKEQLRDFGERLRRALAAVGMELVVVGELSASDFDYLLRRRTEGNGWWAKAGADTSSRRRSDDVLLWFGYVSDEILDSDPQRYFFPSVFLSEPDRREYAIKPYLDPSDSKALSADEIVLRPRVQEAPVLIRFGREVHGFDQVDDAVIELVRVLLRYQERARPRDAADDR